MFIIFLLIDSDNCWHRDCWFNVCNISACICIKGVGLEYVISVNIGVNIFAILLAVGVVGFQPIGFLVSNLQNSTLQVFNLTLDVFCKTKEVGSIPKNPNFVPLSSDEDIQMTISI